MDLFILLNAHLHFTMRRGKQIALTETSFGTWPGLGQENFSKPLLKEAKRK